MFFDVGPLDVLTLAILAVLLFGPDKLPEIIQKVAGFLRKVKEFSDSAKDDIRSELGPEFQDFEFQDLHPKTFVRKHVLDGDGLGLDEIRSALDPRADLAEVADAVREAAAESPREPVTPEPVSLTKDAQTGSSAHTAAFDSDAT
ncbi:sec-independent translocase [Streptomyces sp. NPDC048277]|uniref:sec-independent translocase n=1 Tax=Streptomyces sp. NPDC048277 TaxID=3155027 RepID=UPI0033F35C50